MARMVTKSSSVLRSSLLHHHRSSSTSLFRRYSSKPELIEIEFDSSSSSPSSIINKMEEMVHEIIVKKSTPDWLPFLPGSSFWVPLPGSKPVKHFVEHLTNQLTPDESLSLTTGRGWPCSSFYLPDDADVGMKVEISEEDDGEFEVAVVIGSGKKSS